LTVLVQFSVIQGMSKKRKRRHRKKKKKPAKPGIPGCGLGPHQQVSPMGHATCTKTPRDKQISEQRKEKQQGYENG